MKSLVIAEKPSVARDIARVLKSTKQTNGAMEGDKYIVTWALGHLVTLADPEDYDAKYKEWTMEQLPMIPGELKLEVIKQTSKQYQAVKAQINRKDVSEIIIATDAGREGELVARLILNKAQSRKPIKRLWISSVTDKAIRDGFAKLKDGREYENLYSAAMSRAEADWLVGINATRALTCKYNAQLSCGRVQTPTLGMVAKREEEIKAFQPKPYYGIKGAAEGITLTWQEAGTGGTSTFQKEKISKILEEITHQPGILESLQKTPKKIPAPLLYDLTELQREASQRFQFSPKETLNIMQRLYENHKVLTYPRTDSRYLSADVTDTIKDRLRAISIGPYKKLAGAMVNRPVSKNAFFIDDKKVSDHHAIIPTEQYVQLDHMTVEERKIYDLVVRRFLAVLYPPYEYEQTKAIIRVGKETFTAKGKIMKAAGWKEVYEGRYENDDEDTGEQESFLKDQKLPELTKNQRLHPIQFTMTEGKTKPPAHFSEATLLSAMENPIKFLDTKDKNLIKTLGETGGLGTVATRADIMEKLFNSFLLEKKGQDILPTSKAKQLLELVPADLKKPELTANWEMRLSQIAKGAIKREQFMADIRSYTRELIGEIKSGQGSFRHDNLTNTKCPDCGKKMLAVNGKTSKMLVCQDRECGHREVLSRTSNARCPQCHKRMELTGKGEKQAFTCVCGHREKLEAFQDRRKKEGAGVSKKEVAAYLKNQQTKAPEPLNNAFAEALKGINL